MFCQNEGSWLFIVQIYKMTAPVKMVSGDRIALFQDTTGCAGGGGELRLTIEIM